MCLLRLLCVPWSFLYSVVELLLGRDRSKLENIDHAAFAVHQFSVSLTSKRIFKFFCFGCACWRPHCSAPATFHHYPVEGLVSVIEVSKVNQSFVVEINLITLSWFCIRLSLSESPMPTFPFSAFLWYLKYWIWKHCNFRQINVWVNNDERIWHFSKFGCPAERNDDS